MIYIRNNGYQTYEQDIRELLQAFFPGEELTGEEGAEASFEVDVDSLVTGSGKKLSGIRFEDKSLIKEILYDHLAARTGKQLPWGTLTGIKPVKLAAKILNTAGLAGETARILGEKYRLSAEKARLCAELSVREKELMERIPGDRWYSLYAGIPFCPSRCLYCSFTSNPVSLWRERIGEYLSCVEKELEAITKKASGKLRPATVYVGGGTPTALEAEDLEKFLRLLETYIDMEGVEFTVESGRPDSITPEKLSVMKGLGVQRISINPQTMNDKTLSLIGRRHTAEDVVRAFREAREAGFDNINMDLIMGLPGEDAEDVRKTLSEVEDLRPDSLTVHTLAVKRAARLSTEHDPWTEFDRAEGQQAAEMVRMGSETAGRLGMVPYYLYRQKNMAGNQDNTGYAVPGKECLYNIIMMDEKQPVIGIGAGSTTKFGEKRFENVKDIGNYLSRIDELVEKRNTFLEIQGCFQRKDLL